jgi:hypothetical protein
MAKTLENNVKGSGFVRRIKTGALALVAVASIGLASCKQAMSPDSGDEPGKPGKPNYPTLSLSDVNLNEGEDKSIDLSKLTSESGITWTGVGAYDSKLVTPTLTGTNLTVQVSDDITETVPYSIGVNTNEGPAVVKGVINNKFEISGKLKDETFTNQAGIVQLYDSSDNLVGETSTADGNFNLKPGSVASGSKVKLKGKTNTSYRRTLEFNCDTSKDVSDAQIIVFPHPTYDVDGSGGEVNEADYQAIINFVRQINTGSLPDSEGLYRIKKANLDNIIKNEVCKRNSENGTYFSDTAINNYLSYMPEINKLFAGKKDLGSILEVLDNSSLSHKGIAGYFVTTPDDMIGTKGGTGLEESFYQNPANSREITSALIHFIPTEHLSTALEEWAHLAIAPVLYHNEEEVISNLYTVLYPSAVHKSTIGLADEEVAKILYNSSVLVGEKLENILGM